MQGRAWRVWSRLALVLAALAVAGTSRVTPDAYAETAAACMRAGRCRAVTRVRVAQVVAATRRSPRSLLHAFARPLVAAASSRGAAPAGLALRIRHGSLLC